MSITLGLRCSERSAHGLQKKGGTMPKFIVISQEQLDTINVINNMKVDNLYTVLDEYEDYSTICQYSKKYDNLHIVSVKTENLDKTKSMLAG